MKKEFYNMDGITLAKSLLNKYLIREYENKKIITKIVETEAYMGANDKAAHAYKNKKSTRTAPLYLSGGHIYVYLIYGMYNCLNLSANKENIDRGLSGKSIFGSELYIEDNSDNDFEIVVDKRINIDYAEEYKDKLWRFYIKNNKYVSVIKR